MPSCKLAEQSVDKGKSVACNQQFIVKQNEPPVVRIVVADANVMGCRLLSDALQREQQFRVVGLAVDGQELRNAIRSAEPDIALVNSHLQDGALSGMSLAHEIRQEFPHVRVVLLLDRAEPHLVVRAFRAGARGIFSRTEADLEILCKCINRVYEGQIWADTEQLHYLLEHLSSPTGENNAKRAATLLTAREQTVVRLVAEGMSNREIAHKLKLSEHTVKNYIFRIFDKLGLSNRVELVLYAVTNLTNDGPDENPAKPALRVPAVALGPSTSRPLVKLSE